MVTPHTGWYLPSKGGAWVYTVAGWNVVPIAVSVIDSMLEDGFFTRDDMEDVKDDYIRDAIMIIGSRDTEAAGAGLIGAVGDVVGQFIDGIEVEYEHLHDDEETPENARKAFEIAADHLYEFPDYYYELDAMERRLTKKWRR